MRNVFTNEVELFLIYLPLTCFFAISSPYKIRAICFSKIYYVVTLMALTQPALWLLGKYRKPSNGWGWIGQAAQQIQACKYPGSLMRMKT